MEKQIKKIGVLFVAILICITILIINNSGSKTTTIIDDSTGTIVQEKISCLPSSEESKEIYRANGISLAGLPECKDYKINGVVTSKDGVIKNNKLFDKILVRPLAWFLIQIGNLFNNYFVAFCFLIIIKSIFTFFNNLKLTKNNLKIAKVKPLVDELSNKYNKTSDYWNDDNPYNEQLAKINYINDLQKIYKDNNIKPASGLLMTFFQIFVFIAFLNILYTIPAFFETKLFGIGLGISLSYLFKLNFVYALLLMITFILFTLTSTIVSSQKLIEFTKSNIIMSLVVSGLLIFAIFSLPIGIVLYFIISDIFIVISKIIIYFITRKTHIS
jgi:membrane protein insertase Oxa1/YidC/SpoIIIJ